MSDVALPIDGTELQWIDHLPEHLPDAIHLGKYMQVKPGELLITFPEVARYRVTNGKRIEIALLSEDAHSTAAFFLMATPFGALIHQRGELPLHASAVVPPGGDRALLIAGHSGAGKSTLAAAFAKRGWTVLNDDVSRIYNIGSNVKVWPGFAALKLWQQSCDLLKLDSASLPATRGKKQKYFWQASGSHHEPLPIAAIVELKYIPNSSNATKIRQAKGGEAIQLLIEQTFRPRLIRPLGNQAKHFMQMRQVAGQHACYQVINSHALAPDTLADELTALLNIQ